MSGLWEHRAGHPGVAKVGGAESQDCDVTLRVSMVDYFLTGETRSVMGMPSLAAHCHPNREVVERKAGAESRV